MADKPRHLLAGYAAEILDRDERRDLMEAALADQDVFDQLVEEESWRRVLNAPGMRRELLEALEDRSVLQGLLDWFRLPQARWALGGAAAALTAAVLLPLSPWSTGVDAPPPAGEELTAKSATTRSLSNDLAPKVTAPPGVRELSYGLELWTAEAAVPVGSDYELRGGDEFRIRVEADVPVWLYLFNQSEGDDEYSVVYPLDESEHAASEGDVLLPPGKDEWLGMDETPEDERLVLVVGTAPWPGFEPGRESVSREDLEAAFAGAEQELSAKSWRRFVEGDRVHLKIADPDGELFFVERLFVD